MTTPTILHMTNEVALGPRSAADPEEVLRALSEVLDGAEVPPPIRYALAVVLVAQEVIGTVESPPPDRLHALIRELLGEVGGLYRAPAVPDLLQFPPRP